MIRALAAAGLQVRTVAVPKWKYLLFNRLMYWSLSTHRVTKVLLRIAHDVMLGNSREFSGAGTSREIWVYVVLCGKHSSNTTAPAMEY